MTPAEYFVQKTLGFLALVAFTILLIALSSCTCDPGVEYCGEPSVSADKK